uniref:Bicarbonate transporter-like transmembrane domain-containing protein n=1 Tax=Knipowitschia caucasica TaxID=637954 RepID=A0AAV2K9C7_KNICA
MRHLQLVTKARSAAVKLRAAAVEARAAAVEARAAAVEARAAAVEARAAAVEARAAAVEARAAAVEARAAAVEARAAAAATRLALVVSRPTVEVSRLTLVVAMVEAWTDLLIVSVMLGVCSILGLPWFVAATVLSISHVNSLKVESECSAPGEQPKFLGIREQRVTGFMIFMLMGCSVFMTSVLKFIPMPVLYGVFLYMGVSSLKGIQFFDRIKLFGMPAKHQPDLIYLRYVPLWKVHVFTLVQLSCLVLLWVIKASAAAVVFPMMVLALVFVRKLLDFFFTKRELSWLDDLIPESKKKKEDDKKKKAQEKLVLAGDEDRALKMAFEASNRLALPVKTLTGKSYRIGVVTQEPEEEPEPGESGLC